MATTTAVPATTKHLTKVETTAILHAAGTDWDDLVINMEEALADFYDTTNGTRPRDDNEPYTAAAMRWARGKADRWAVELNPAKDV